MKFKRLIAIILSLLMVLGCVCAAGASQYTVSKGDSLWSIAKQQLGSGYRWTEIYEANKDQIKNPNLLHVGQQLTIPSTEQEPETGSSSFVTYSFAETEAGWLMGYHEDSTYIFKGIQYGVAERFMPAEKPAAWNGVRGALSYKETAPNTNTTVSVSQFVGNMNSDMVQNENCLYLNVWTQSLDSSAKKPVIFFIHGGGYVGGASNELACYDGKNISEYGDVVYVNVNHRLNYLGYTDLSAYGGEYADSGNLGQLDLVLALEWVRDNIENFGGDSSNVTIVGQSGGASKVCTLLGMPAAKGLFTKAAMLSGGVRANDSATAEAAGVALVEKCKTTYGLSTDEEALAKLKEISYEDLALLAGDTGVGTKPVYGTPSYPEIAYDSATGKWCDLAKDVPLIISNTFGEQRGNDGILVMDMLINMMGGRFDPENPDAFLADYYKPNLTEDDMLRLVTARYGEKTEKILNLFAKAYPCRDSLDVLSLNNRLSSIQSSYDKAAQGGAPVYNCVFSYEYPLMGGITNFHTDGDLLLWFRNVDKGGQIVKGDEEGAWKVSAEAASALIQYAYTGDPSTDTLKWAPFTTENGETMQFDDVSQVLNYPDKELLEFING